MLAVTVFIYECLCLLGSLFVCLSLSLYIMLFLIKCALDYDMGPGAHPVILPVTEPRNQAREYLVGPLVRC